MTDHIIVEKIKSGDRPIRFWLPRFFLECWWLALPVEGQRPRNVPDLDLVGKHGRAMGAGCCALKDLRQSMSIENVVAEDQRNAIVADKVLADQEGLRKTLRRWLRCI